MSRIRIQVWTLVLKKRIQDPIPYCRVHTLSLVLFHAVPVKNCIEVPLLFFQIRTLISAALSLEPPPINCILDPLPFFLIKNMRLAIHHGEPVTDCRPKFSIRYFLALFRNLIIGLFHVYIQLLTVTLIIALRLLLLLLLLFLLLLFLLPLPFLDLVRGLTNCLVTFPILIHMCLGYFVNHALDRDKCAVTSVLPKIIEQDCCLGVEVL